MLKVTLTVTFTVITTAVIVYYSSKQILDMLTVYPNCFPPFEYIPGRASMCRKAPTDSDNGVDEGLGDPIQQVWTLYEYTR